MGRRGRDRPRILLINVDVCRLLIFFSSFGHQFLYHKLLIFNSSFPFYNLPSAPHGVPFTAIPNPFDG